MHLIFERSNGRFKSNCNILALSWCPFYEESKFRQAYLEYQHRLVTHVGDPAGGNDRPSTNNGPARQAGANIANNNIVNNFNHNNNQHAIRGQHNPMAPLLAISHLLQESYGRPGAISRRRPVGQGQIDDETSRVLERELASKRRRLSNSRLYEQYQRYVYMRYGVPRTSSPATCSTNKPTAPGPDPISELAYCTDAVANDRVDRLFGRNANFGWLAIGNIGRIVGITLTSIVEAPREIDGRCLRLQQQQQHCLDMNDHDDLIILSDDARGMPGQKKPSLLGVPTKCVREQRRPDRKCERSNFNLRGHMDEIILIKWNELYQKLASVDSKGNVLIWTKNNEKFTIQTPFYNQTKSVADFKWSNDGKTALICYTNAFILVGVSINQRHWHSMLELEDYHITCAAWSPSDEQLYLGVSSGKILVIDIAEFKLSQQDVSEANIRTMCWSSSELNLRNGGCSSSLRDDNVVEPATTTTSGSKQESAADDWTTSDSCPTRDHNQQQELANSANLVSRGGLSRCRGPSCRYQPATNHSREHSRRTACTSRLHRPVSELESSQSGQSLPASGNHKDILAIDLDNNTIKLFNGGLSDQKPHVIQVNLESYLMAWSLDGKILAVAGFNVNTSAPSVGYLRCKYLNTIKFYNQQGSMIYEKRMNYTRYPITALTWAHDDKRLFVATGPRLHCAKVYMGIPCLRLLSYSCLQQNTKLMDKSDVLKNLVQKQLVPNVLNWQSFNCPLDIGSSLSSTGLVVQSQPLLSEYNHRSDSSASSSDKSSMMPPLMMTMETGESGGSGTDAATANRLNNERTISLVNNINIANYQLPAKLKARIDQLFAQTVRQPYDEQLTLNDIAWHVPKNRQRHYCTLICYTHELADVGCIGHQYKARELIDGKRIGSTGLDNRDSCDQFKIFILYAEFQGSLIPILKARRIGFLKPEFVIFDPEDNPNSYYQRTHKVSDISNQSRSGARDGGCRRMSSRMADSVLNSNCVVLHGAPCGESSSSSANRRQFPSMNEPVDHRLAFNQNLNNPLLAEQVKSKLAFASSGPSTSVLGGLRDGRGHISNSGRNDGRQILQDPNFVYLLNLVQQKSNRDRQPIASNTTTLQHELLQAIERQRIRAPLRGSNLSGVNKQSLANSNGQLGQRSLPENSELIRIKSNIWGTKFKLINMGTRRIGPRAVLGSVKYKASLLHLQPRQIYLNLKDMSNYCALCSMHHHTRLPPRRQNHQQAHKSTSNNCARAASSAAPEAVGLMDLPIGLAPSHLATPVRSSSRRQSRSRQRFGYQDPAATTTTRKADDKVTLPVGDNIRVAPKLEPNQRYKFANSFDSATTSGISNSSTRNRQHFSLQSQSSTHTNNLRLKSSSQVTKRSDSSHSKASQSTDPTSSWMSTESASSNTVPCGQDDDILTLSLDQGDQVQVEMSSSAPARGPRSNSLEPRPTGPDAPKVDHQKMEEFLQSNKTLKSIQTITKMIVDLSSRAHDDEASQQQDNQMETNQSSPVKLLKMEDGDGAPLRSPARSYLPPETPVHRPRRFASNNRTSTWLQQAQSATSSPLANPRRAGLKLARNNSTEHEPLSLHPDDPLPAPPPSVPFRRKLSTSAKRFFDGSLRSLAGISGGNAAGYLTSDDPDSEECETLVHRRLRDHRSRAKTTTRHQYQSQPCTPSKEVGGSRLMNARRPNGKQSALDLASLRSQVVQKLRQSTSWMSSSKDLADDGHGPYLAPADQVGRHSRPDKQHARSKSCTKRSSWIHKSASKQSGRAPPEVSDILRSSSFSSSSSSSGSSSSSDLISLISSSGSSQASLSSSDDEANSTNRDFGFLDPAIRSKLFKRSSKLSSSAREFGELGNKPGHSSTKSSSRRLGIEMIRRKLEGTTTNTSGAREQKPSGRRHRRRVKKSICQNANCCCAREFKLSNRPPVWNECNQVYQLDFGGRVTQESAKNLQIDFNGSLALQFGRIDKCTYTLDYQFPFNAVQAMSIALASLTQRLK